MRGGRKRIDEMKNTIDWILVVTFVVAICFLFQGNPSVYDALRSRVIYELKSPER
jgi:hypothetical protein